MDDPLAQAPDPVLPSDITFLLQSFEIFANEVVVPVWRALHTAVRRAVESPIRAFRDGSRSRLNTRRRPRNTRVQMAQAKRKCLGLPPDGKLTGLNRKDSYGYAAWLQGQRSDPPRIVVSRRDRRRQERRARYQRERHWRQPDHSHCHAGGAIDIRGMWFGGNDGGPEMVCSTTDARIDATHYLMRVLNQREWENEMYGKWVAE